MFPGDMKAKVTRCIRGFFNKPLMHRVREISACLTPLFCRNYDGKRRTLFLK